MNGFGSEITRQPFGRKWMFAALFSFALLCWPGSGRGAVPIQGRPFGLGLAVGEPTGITAKLWLNEKSALDFSLGYGYYPFGGPTLYLDYLFAFVDLSELGVTSHLFMHIGLGAKVGYWSSNLDGRDAGTSIGVRVPFGIDLIFERSAFELFFEAAPCLAFLAPRPTWFDMDAAIGFRYYF